MSEPESQPDLNLLTALDALLAEGSVAGAARRLGLSASAMSRTLARLRSATGDPLLVRAGRGMVPTPRAVALREQVGNLARDACAVLRPVVDTLDLATLERTFTLRTNEGFVAAYAARLIAAAAAVAPGVRLCFVLKPDKNAEPLRDGSIDLEIGVLGKMGPEVRIQALFRDHFMGVVRQGHPLAADAVVTPQRYVEYGHVVASRHGIATGPVDEALAALGLTRRVAAIVPGFPAALAVACASDLVALVPQSALAAVPDSLPHTGTAGIFCFPLPVATRPITVSQMWHPRLDSDPAHRWLRQLVKTVCQFQPQPQAV